MRPWSPPGKSLGRGETTTTPLGSRASEWLGAMFGRVFTRAGVNQTEPFCCEDGRKPPRESILQEARHPIGDWVATTHVGLNQSVDHEAGRHVDAVLAAILAVPLHLSIKVGDHEGFGKLHAAIALDPPDDVVGGGIKIRPAAVVVV